MNKMLGIVLLVLLIQVPTKAQEGPVPVLMCNGSTNGCSAYEGEPVNFDASLSSTEPGSSIVLYEYDFGDGATYASATESVVEHSYPDNRLYIATLTVSDN